MLGWDESVPLIVQIAEDFVETATMHPGVDMIDALMAEHVAACRRARNAERMRAARARPDAGVVRTVVCPVCGSSFPSTCAAAHRPRRVCGRKCRGRAQA